MKLKSITRSMVFIPEFNGNKKEKPEKQFKVNLKSYPSGAQIGTYKIFRFKDGATEIVYANPEIMINHVESLDNFGIGEDIIDTPVKLCDYQDPRLYPLIVEIRTHLLKESEDIEEGEG